MTRRLQGGLRIAAKLSALRSAMMFGLSGSAFALGNLLLARAMPVEQFGEFSFVLALFNIFCLLAPLGIDQLALRSPRNPSLKLGGMIFVSGLVLGGLVAIVTSRVEQHSARESLLIMAAICAGGLLVTASAMFRALSRPTVALALFTGGNWALLAIGGAAQWLAPATWQSPFLFFTISQAIIALVGWGLLLRGHRNGRGADDGPISWREAMSLLGIVAVGTLSLQLERIIIPPLLDLRALALFSVLASVAIFPFRMVTAGLEFSLTPRLQAETHPRKRLRLFRHEVVSIVLVLLVACVFVMAMAAWVASWLTAGRYELSDSVIAAACVNGGVKFVQLIPRSVLTACGSSRDLSILNATGWLGCLSSIGGAILCSPYGLTGILLGIAAGSFMGSLPALYLAKQALRQESFDGDAHVTAISRVA